MSEQGNIKTPKNVKSPEEIVQDGILPTEDLSAAAGTISQGLVPKAISDLVPAETRAKTKDELEADLSLVRLQSEKLRLTKETLELERLENEIQEIRRKKEAQKIARETVQESLSFEREKRISDETNCTHMKGGDSGSMMHGGPAQGNDASNFAMIQHTLTTGVTFRMCLRCGKTWFPKDNDYRWAMTRPTRNSPSTGSPSPGLVRNVKNVRLISEVPHIDPSKISTTDSFYGNPFAGQ